MDTYAVPLMIAVERLWADKILAARKIKQNKRLEYYG
jgi:hypothetical protein